MNLTFELTLDEANLILVSLSKQPFETVSGLIAKIQSQAAPQVQPKTEVAEKTTEKKLKKA